MAFISGKWWYLNEPEDIIWVNGSEQMENMTDIGDTAIPPSCALYVFIVKGIMCFLYACFGLAGNILGLMALTRVRIAASTIFLLRCVAAVDIIYLSMYFIAACIPEFAFYIAVSILHFNAS